MEISTALTTVPVSETTTSSVQTTLTTTFASTADIPVTTLAATTISTETTAAATSTTEPTTVTEPIITELQTTVTKPTTECLTTVQTQPAQRYADTSVLQVALLVNIEREKHGLAPLLYSDKLGEMAQVRANEILTAFGHTRPDGRSCFSIFDDFEIRYKCIAENIAAGQETPAVAVEWWMNSDAHRNNILNPDFRYIGVENVSQDGVQYWTQIFADADGLDGIL
ncbi:MAG: CAP domain-containing protein [Oscillospiraceae bacterium]|nr:CAP domain-containing protein [Oscillospiraceae bacterium]